MHRGFFFTEVFFLHRGLFFAQGSFLLHTVSFFLRTTVRALREHEFKLLDHLSPDDYSLIVRYNLARKLLLSLTILFELRFGLTVFLFTFLLISIQLFYVNLTIGWYQFDSAVTRSLVIFSEVVMSSVVLLSLVECLNQAFDKYSNLHNLDYLRLITVRINTNLTKLKLFY